jgi:hypothetical protein
MHVSRHVSSVLLSALVLALGVGCASSKPPTPQDVALVAPQPIQDGTGKFRSPYTQDGVLAEWVTKFINTGSTSQVAGALGATAGSMALRQVPFVGGMLGNAAGKQIGRQAAIAAAGGHDFIAKSSDQSFKSADDLGVWMFANYSTNEHYASAVKALSGVYPEYPERSQRAVMVAVKKQQQMVKADPTLASKLIPAQPAAGSAKTAAAVQ